MKRRLDNFRGSWLVIIALGCLGGITVLGLGSERVRRAVRAHLPAVLGGAPAEEFKPPEAPPEKPPEKPPDPDALPQVPAETSIRGSVKDREGKPIPGAVVSAERWRYGKWESLGSAKTNKAGLYVLGPLPRASLSAVARAAGYASERKAAPTGSSVDFTLKTGGSLAGRVVDAVTGEPVKECGLRGWSESGNWYEQETTDKDGGFRFSSIPPGRVWLEVSPREHRETNINDLDVREGAETFKEIPVVRGGLLKGKVLDMETGSPVAGVKLRTWGGEKEATSGEDGSYEIPSPPQGGIGLRLTAADYPPQWTWLSLSGDPNGTFEREVRIARGGKVSGSVRKSDGTPAPGARVGLDPSNLLTGVPEETATADAEGRFVLDGVPAMDHGRLFAVADGFALTRSDPFDLRPGTETGGIAITLREGTTMRGKVTDEEHQPLAGACITLNRIWVWSPDGDNQWYWIPPVVGYSVADGTYEIRSIPESRYMLQVALEGYAPESRSNLEVQSEGTLEGQDFVLRRGDSITGRVIGPDGQPVQGAQVNAWGWVPASDGSWAWVQRSDVRTDPEGRFLLDGLRPGGYQVNISLSGFLGASLGGVASGTRDLQVHLEPNPRIEGTVLEADTGKPCPTFRLRVYLEANADGALQQGENVVLDQEFADREGKFSLRDLPPGRVSIEAIAGTRISPRSTGIFIRGGTVVEGVRLLLREGGRLEVRVTDGGGSPVKGASVSAARLLPDGGMNYEQWAQTEEDGHVAIAAMSDGRWVVQAESQGKVRASRTVDLRAGSDASVDLVLRVGGSVLVRVVDPEGKPVAGATVQFFEREGENPIELDWQRIWEKAQKSAQAGRIDWSRFWQEAQQTSAEGRLLREGLPPGRLLFTVAHGEFKPANGTVAVIDGFEVDLSARMEPKAEKKPEEK